MSGESLVGNIFVAHDKVSVPSAASTDAVSCCKGSKLSTVLGGEGAGYEGFEYSADSFEAFEEAFGV